MAHDAEELLTLLKNVEIDERNLQVVVVEVALHTVEMTLAHYREFVFQSVGIGKHFVVGCETSTAQHGFSALHELLYLMTQRRELFRINAWYGVEIVFYMLFYRFEESLETVDELLVAICASVEPCVALQCHVCLHSL